MIHILQIVGDPVGGIRKHVHSLINGLDATHFKSSYVYSSRAFDQQFQADLAEMTLRSVSCLPLTIYKRPTWHDVINIIKIRRFVIENQVDILHGHGAKGGVYARIVAKLTGKKSIYTPHGGTVHAAYSRVESVLYGIVERWLLRWTHYLVFESQYTMNAYKKLIQVESIKGIVNYNGVELINPNELPIIQKPIDWREDCYHIGVVGMLRPMKGQLFALKALPHLLSQGFSVHFHFYGEGEQQYKTELLKVVGELNLSDHVTFYGDVTPILSYMNQMDIILIPSLHESFGYVALEAAQLGKWIVASKVGGLKEIVPHIKNGYLIEPGEVKGIINTLSSIMSSHSAQSLREQVKILFPDLFVLSNMIVNLEGIYQKVYQGKIE